MALQPEDIAEPGFVVVPPPQPSNTAVAVARPAPQQWHYEPLPEPDIPEPPPYAIRGLEYWMHGRLVGRLYLDQVNKRCAWLSYATDNATPWRGGWHLLEMARWYVSSILTAGLTCASMWPFTPMATEPIIAGDASELTPQGFGATTAAEHGTSCSAEGARTLDDEQPRRVSRNIGGSQH